MIYNGYLEGWTENVAIIVLESVSVHNWGPTLYDTPKLLQCRMSLHCLYSFWQAFRLMRLFWKRDNGGRERRKTTITENQPIWSHGPQPCLTQRHYEPCYVGPPKMDGSWWRVLTKCDSLEKGMVGHFSILALRTPWTVWKGKKAGHWRMNSPGW